MTKIVAAATALTLVIPISSILIPEPADPPLSLAWSDEILTISGANVPGGSIRIWYIEAFCRPGSTDRDWHETVIPHKTQLLEKSPDGRMLKLRSTLDDGVIITHEIEAGSDEVTFRVTAENPTKQASQAHWAQPCIRVDRFVGVPAKPDSEEYLGKSFIVLDGKPAFLPTKPWATRARYTPGQVWCPKHVDRNDVNPRPLSALVPSNGLIGCVSKDNTQLLATAWEPYQELFQGVITCLHSDFRIGGLNPGEIKTICGKLYLVPNNLKKLIERYERDFPEHQASR